MKTGWLEKLFAGSVRRQLILGVALVHAAMMSLFIWDLTVRQKQLLLDQQTSQAQSLSESVATSSEVWLVSRDLNGLQEIIRAQERHPGLVFAMALDKDGLVLAHTDRTRRGQYVADLPRSPEPAVLHRSARLVDVVSPAHSGNEHVGWIRIGLAQHGAAEQLFRITRNGIFYALAAILIGIVIAFYMARNLTARLYAIRAAADAVKAGAQDVRVRDDGTDETAALARDFNRMLDTLGEREQELLASRDALRESEARMRRVMRGANDGAWEWDMKTQYVTYSPRWKSMLGYDDEELEPTLETWKRLCDPEDVPLVMAAVQEYIDGKRSSFEVEFRMRHKDGHWVPVLSRAHLERDEAGQPWIFSGTHVDLTESKAAEAEHGKLQGQLMQAQKMESIGHLTGGIAHDFNNMLGAIMGYAELLRQVCDTPTATPERTRRYLGEILTAGNRAKELISQMLVFSRVGPESRSGDMPVILVKPVIKEVAQLLRSTIPSTVEVNYDFPEEDLHVRIHPVQLHQVLLNLAINARDAMGEYGRIDLTLTRSKASGTCASCHQEYGGEQVELRVQDYGSGIPENMLHQIFDPFFTTKEVGKGTGMGLSVVHGIVHAARGHIAVASALGVGTSISILLPLIEMGPGSVMGQTTQPMSAANDDLSGLHVMVVDDEQSVAEMLHEALELHGARVTVHQRASDALADFERRPDAFDLVITDESMPELSGMDMARSMLQHRPGIPVILCTGFSEHVNEALAHSQGIAEFMHKPVKLDHLLRRVRELGRS